MSSGTDDNDGGGGADHICGSTDTASGDPCRFPVKSPDDRCHMHPADGSGPPDGHGSGDPGHAINAPGGIQENLPENAKPSLDHGMHAVQDDPGGLLLWLEDNDPEGYRWVVDKWRSYLADAPFPWNSAKADDVLHACLIDYVVRGHRQTQLTRGLTKMLDVPTDAGAVTVEDEHPANLAANRLARHSLKLKREAGVLDDPESQKAEAMGWGEAAKRVAQRVDSEASDVPDADDADADDPDVIDP